MSDLCETCVNQGHCDQEPHAGCDYCQRAEL